MIRSLFHRSRDRALSISLSATSRNVLRRHLTLLSPQNLHTIEQCVRNLDDNGVPGDLVQCGIDPGGVSAVLISMLSLARHFRGYTTISGSLDQTVNGCGNAVPALGFEIDNQRISFHTADPQSGSLCRNERTVALTHINGGDPKATEFYLKALISLVPPGGFIVINDHNTHDSSRAIIEHFLGSRPEFTLDHSIRSSFVLKNGRPH